MAKANTSSRKRLACLVNAAIVEWLYCLVLDCILCCEDGFTSGSSASGRVTRELQLITWYTSFIVFSSSSSALFDYTSGYKIIESPLLSSLNARSYYPSSIVRSSFLLSMKLRLASFSQRVKEASLQEPFLRTNLLFLCGLGCVSALLGDQYRELVMTRSSGFCLISRVRWRVKVVSSEKSQSTEHFLSLAWRCSRLICSTPCLELSTNTQY